MKISILVDAWWNRTFPVFNIDEGTSDPAPSEQEWKQGVEQDIKKFIEPMKNNKCPKTTSGDHNFKEGVIKWWISKIPINYKKIGGDFTLTRIWSYESVCIWCGIIDDGKASVKTSSGASGNIPIKAHSGTGGGVRSFYKEAESL